MKKIIVAMAAASLALLTYAGVLEVFGTPKTTRGGKLSHIEAISTVASGTVSVKSESLYYTNGVEVVQLAPVTNTTFVLVYRDGAATVTNVTTTPVDFSYIGTNYISYATNTVVVTPAVTNAVSLLALAVTNTVDSLTCTSGAGSKTPEDAWIQPGKLWYDGSAKGRVWVYIQE